jgi:pyrimidine deaminase RibD-like protein
VLIITRAWLEGTKVYQTVDPVVVHGSATSGSDAACAIETGAVVVGSNDQSMAIAFEQESFTGCA